MVKRIQALVERQAGFDGPAGVDTGGPHQARQQRPRDDGAVEQRPEERNLKTFRGKAETTRRARGHFRPHVVAKRPPTNVFAHLD